MIAAAEFIIVGLGGALGAMTRFGIQQASPLPIEKVFHTAAINLAGCLAIGVAWAALNHFNAPTWMNRLLITGFLGGFTTFSAFSLDVMTLMQAGKAWCAALYVGLSVIGGIILCGIGLWGTTKLLST